MNILLENLDLIDDKIFMFFDRQTMWMRNRKYQNQDGNILKFNIFNKINGTEAKPKPSFVVVLSSAKKIFWPQLIVLVTLNWLEIWKQLSENMIYWPPMIKQNNWKFQW